MEEEEEEKMATRTITATKGTKPRGIPLTRLSNKKGVRH